MFSPCSAKKRASDKDLPVDFAKITRKFSITIVTGQFVNTLKIFIVEEDLTVSYNHHRNIEGIQGDPFKQLFSKIIIQITVKLGDKEPFDKEQIGVKEPFSVTNFQFTS